MKFDLVFSVDGIPQAFTQKKVSKYGVPYRVDKKGFKKAWQESIRFHAMQYKDQFIPKPEAVMLLLEFYMPRAKNNKLRDHTIRPDIDNLAYPVTNALKGILFDDDSQIVCLEMYKQFANENRSPGVIIHVQKNMRF